MPVYEYKGFNAQGKAVQGVLEADGAKSLKALLRKDGILITEVYEEKVGNKQKTRLGSAAATNNSVLRKDVDFKKFFQRIHPQEVSLFTRDRKSVV